jgi:hypothetical protein
MSLETQLLTLWERGYNASPIDRALLLSTVANSDDSMETVLDLPIGLRDGSLMKFRRALFGSHITSTIPCNNCATTLELSFDLNPLIDMMNNVSTSSFSIDWQGTVFELRCPSTRDLIDVSKRPRSKRSTAILERCLVTSEPSLFDRLQSSELQQLVASAIEGHDPLADIEYSMCCLACSHTFCTSFDIVAFLWCELNAWCQRLMGEVHVLAKSYGWTEAEILRLSSWRRQVYLNMIRQ